MRSGSNINNFNVHFLFALCRYGISPCQILSIFKFGSTEAPAGVEVWVGNLPRKRKVERDLRAVFRNAAGLLHIRPIVEPENEKTREPMCRGFAFFTFATEEDAYE